MNTKLSSLPAPALAGVVRETTARGAISRMESCATSGASMIDLHLSCLKKRDIPTLINIISSSRLPILALNYNKTYEWEDCGFSEEERVQSLLDAVEAGAAGIDMQGYTFDEKSKGGYFGEDIYSFTKANPKEIVTDSAIISAQCDLIERVHQKGAEVLLSCHPGIVMGTDAVVELALFLQERHPDIIKIVTAAKTEEDYLTSIETMLALKRELKIPVTYHVNGRAGRLSRVINPILGGHIAFCVDYYDEGSTPEQLRLDTVRAIVDGIGKIK